MLDLIIPAYNAHDTIIKALLSICLQTCRDKLNIVIVNDASEKDYSHEISLFSDRLNIIQINNENNSGPAVSRQVGIDNSDSDYIMFMDADDLLYDCFSISNVLKNINNENFDIISGMMVEETDKGIVVTNEHFGCLHGKIYRRKFLHDNHICFNNSRIHEDNAFNQFVLTANPKIRYINNYIYVYKNNKNSVTRRESKIELLSINEYVKNMLWVVERSEANRFSEEKIARLLVSSMGYSYWIYCANINNPKSLKILSNVMPLYQKYKKYSPKLKENVKNNLISFYLKKVETDISFSDFTVMIEKYNNM